LDQLKLQKLYPIYGTHMTNWTITVLQRICFVPAIQGK